MGKLLLEQITRDASGQVLVRSKVRAVSRRMGFSQVTREQIEIVCNEMVTNQLKYADGNGILQMLEIGGNTPALDLFAMDYGSGIDNLQEAMVDGFSTSRTLGKGLGTIKRLAHESDIYTLKNGEVADSPWHGTAVWARFYCTPPKKGLVYQAGSAMRAYQDSHYNGDFMHSIQDKHRIRWLHMDALGHGIEAYETVNGIEELLCGNTPLLEIMENVDQRLQGTRGAVAILAEADFNNGNLSVTGAGDMVAYLVCNGEKRSLTFTPGILGHEHRAFAIETHTFPPQALFITASDGLKKNWSLSSYPGLWRLHPQLIALLLIHTTGRGNDDRSLLALRAWPQ